MSNALFDDLAPYYDQWYETPVEKAVDYVERKAVKGNPGFIAARWQK